MQSPEVLAGEDVAVDVLDLALLRPVLLPDLDRLAWKAREGRGRWEKAREGQGRWAKAREGQGRREKRGRVSTALPRISFDMTSSNM